VTATTPTLRGQSILAKGARIYKKRISSGFLTMTSNTLLKVAFSSLPKNVPTLPESSLVEKAIKDAKGTIAKKFRTKMVRSAQPRAPATNPIGKKTKRILM